MKMGTLLGQLTALIQDGALEENVFFIDECPKRPELKGCRCKYLSNSRQGIEFLNLVDDEVQLADQNLECVIAAK